MTAPTETYLAGMNATLSVNGTSLSITDGSYKTEVDVDDMSNNLSGGWEEDVACLKKASGSVKAVYKGSTPPAFDSGDLINLIISFPSGPGISGVARVKGVTKTLTVKGGVKYDFDWKNQGAMTVTK